MTDTIPLAPAAGLGKALTLRLCGLAGLIIFGLGFALTFLSPIHYEKAARGFLEAKVEERIRSRLDVLPEAPPESRVARFTQSLIKRNESEIGELRQKLLSGLNERVSETVARMQDLSCDCRQNMVRALDVAVSLRISTLERAEPQLRRAIEGRYGEIVGELMRDLRIFTGTNLAAFGMLLILSFARPGYMRQLFVPGILLAVSTVIASAFYVFGQNWFFAMLYNDYVGVGYAIWLVLIYGFLLDIALFQARVTTRVIDGMMSGLANALSAGPC